MHPPLERRNWLSTLLSSSVQVSNFVLLAWPFFFFFFFFTICTHLHLVPAWIVIAPALLSMSPVPTDLPLSSCPGTLLFLTPDIGTHSLYPDYSSKNSSLAAQYHFLKFKI